MELDTDALNTTHSLNTNRTAEIECAVCYEPKKKWIVCSCGVYVCTECQERSTFPKCLQCSKLFTKSFWISQNQPQLYLKIQKPWEMQTLWDREQKLLENTQQFVEWEDTMTTLKKQLRFGLTPVFPPKPSAVLTTGSMFPCPSAECRGYCNTRGECGTCKKLTCVKCRDMILEDEKKHKCKEEVLASLKLIETESKPCPSCKVGIQRSQGCSHMFCTFCRTHFDWNTMKILNLNQSTNFHYISSPLLSRLQQRQTETQDCAALAGFVFPIPNPRPYLPNTPLYEALYHAYYSERKRMIYMRNTLFNVEIIERKHEEALIKLRILYVKKAVEKEEYLKKVWSEEQHYDKQVSLASMWTMYLELMALQIIDWRKEGFTDSERQILAFNQNQDLFQEFFTAVCKEYACKCPKFVTLKKGETVPLILL
jgi:hypothetical protein